MSESISRFPLQWPSGWKRMPEGHVEITLQEWSGPALVDADDALWLMNFTWYAHRQGNNIYARTDVHAEGKKRTYLMHRLIMGAKRGQIVDHREGNGLDNRKAMLRFATTAENSANGAKRGTDGHSGFKGVTNDKRRTTKPWLAQITKNYRHTNIGSFSDELTAAAAYDLMAMKLHGPFARTNLGVLVLEKDESGNWVNAITHDPNFRINAARDEAMQEVGNG